MAISPRSRHCRMLLARSQAEFGWTPIKAFGGDSFEAYFQERREGTKVFSRDEYGAATHNTLDRLWHYSF